MTIIYLLLLLSACNVLGAVLDVCGTQTYIQTTQGQTSVGGWKLKFSHLFLKTEASSGQAKPGDLGGPLLPWVWSTAEAEL